MMQIVGGGKSGGIKSVQSGVYDSAGGALAGNTVTIAAVDPEKAFLWINGAMTGGSSINQCAGELVDGTTIKFIEKGNLSVQSGRVAWRVVEFK